MLFKSSFFLAVLVALSMSSCKKPSCYDAELEERGHLVFCSSDCPGVKGCDGKTYCNECIANQNGIYILED